VPIHIPPLRERAEDIPALIEHFLVKYSDEGRIPELDPATIEALVAYHWPGNVRELENTIERLVALAPRGRILPEHLPPGVVEEAKLERLRADVLAGRMDLERAVESFERDVIGEALARSHGVQTRAAELLGISRRILKYKMDRYEIASRGD
jgi:DNA-binding NtrC family response regulator